VARCGPNRKPGQSYQLSKERRTISPLPGGEGRGEGGCLIQLLSQSSKVFFARPHPDVDSLAPARPALWAFGFAEFLSLIPNQLKSPPGRRNSHRLFLILRLTVRQIPSRECSSGRQMIPPAHEPPGSAGVPPASREPKAGNSERGQPQKRRFPIRSVSGGISTSARSEAGAPRGSELPPKQNGRSQGCGHSENVDSNFRFISCGEAKRA
jgi:hypothetical protein